MSFWLVTALLVSSPVHARDLDLIYKNNEAVRQSRKEKHLEAYEEFLGLTASDPYDPILQYNLAASLAANGEVEKSQALYNHLLNVLDERLKTATTPGQQRELYTLKYASLYNLGVQYQAAKDPDKALEAYQRALEIVPDSKEIKTNIEMMFQGGQNGKGKSDQKQQGKDGDGQGQQDPQDQGKDGKQPQPKPQDQNNQGQQKKEFDQKQMGKEDLDRIMDELKQEEENIRAKMGNKGGKNESKEKNW